MLYGLQYLAYRMGGCKTYVDKLAALQANLQVESQVVVNRVDRQSKCICFIASVEISHHMIN